MAKMTEEHKKKISEACKHPKKKLYFRMFFEDGLFQLDVKAGLDCPLGFKPLTVKAIEASEMLLEKQRLYL